MPDDDYAVLDRIIRGRRSVRRFLPRPVPEETVNRLLETARWAPSAGNRQAFRFLVVTSKQVLSAMAESVQQEVDRVRQHLRPDAAAEASAYLDNFTHFAQAPLLIVPIHRLGVDLLAATQQKRPSSHQGSSRAEADALCSVSAAIMNVLLGAHALGLGACWMTGPLIAAEPLRRLLGVPDGWTLSAVIPVGYAAEAPEAPPRRPLKRLVRYVKS